MVLQLSTSAFVSPGASARASIKGPGNHSRAPSSSISPSRSHSHSSLSSSSSASTSVSVSSSSAATSFFRSFFTSHSSNGISGNRGDLSGSSSSFSQGQGPIHRRQHYLNSNSRSKSAAMTTVVATTTEKMTTIVTCSPKSHSKTYWQRQLIRVMGIASVIFVILYVPTLKTQGLKNGFGRGTQYLTIVGLLLTGICLALGFAEDIFRSTGLTKSKNAILPIVVPTEFAIGFLYWTLVFQDVYNIYPDGHRYLPFWLDIQMHGLPFAFVVIEMFNNSPTFRVRRMVDGVGFVLFALAYMSWFNLCAHMDGEWPYPIFENTPCPWQRLRLMLTSTAVAFVLHIIVSESHLRSRTKA